MGRNKNIPGAEPAYGHDCPYIDIQWKTGRIFMSNAVLRLVGNPGGIRFFWNAAKRSLIIAPTTIDDPDGFPVIGRNYARAGSLFVGSATLICAIWKTLDWDKTLRYRIVAKYNEASNVAMFEMPGAVASAIPKNIHGGKPKRFGPIKGAVVANSLNVAG